MAYTPSCPEEAEFLKAYNPDKYKKPGFAADTAVFAMSADALHILLIRRGGYPYKGCWALPGGFVDIDEDIRDTARRELTEETGLTNLYAEQVFTWGRPDRDPRWRTITTSFVALADMAMLRPKAGDDASETGWFALTDYQKDDADGFTTIRYTLSGPQVLCPVVTYPVGRIQQIAPVKSAGLAFDHAESIAYSYEYLIARAQNGFLDLALDNDALRQRARQILFG